MNATAASLATLSPLLDRLSSLDKQIGASAVELALLRAEAAKHELNALFDRLHGREITDDDDARLSAASDAWERTQAELKRAVFDCCGCDLQRLSDSIS